MYIELTSPNGVKQLTNVSKIIFHTSKGDIPCDKIHQIKKVLDYHALTIYQGQKEMSFNSQYTITYANY